MEIITEYNWIFFSLAVIFGLYMTWGIGANDVANAMGTSVGSGAITVKQAIIIAAIFEFAGAFLAGGDVTETIRKGIIDPGPISDRPELLLYGMLAALLSAAIWLMVASSKGWPVSTTHTIVGAVVGFAIVGIGPESVNWGEIGKIVASWIISPVLGGVIGFVLMVSIRKFIINANEPIKMARRYGPFYVFLAAFIVVLVSLFKGLKHLKLDVSDGQKFLWATILGVLLAFVGKIMINRVKVDAIADKNFHYTSVERMFRPMMIFTACAMAFAHGSNDVANGIGPMAAVIGLIQSGGKVAQESEMPIWILLMGGGGIVVGLATLGYRVMQTIGEKITELTPTRGYSATLGAAFTVVLASTNGIPVSTTHIAVGAVLGVGLARGISAVDLRVLINIVVSWLVTLPVGAGLAALIFFILKGIFS
ncbi:MAG TPA: inorganic phosphate transporter [Verrucomicrobia bacterium]|nr:inorganic phosphate transporter [Verrucomicrobiales bacterium]HIL55237.1 inorganic phosphate transporter [Verrucomicrobiota bacterium]